jgi:hypothetical protein
MLKATHAVLYYTDDVEQATVRAGRCLNRKYTRKLANSAREVDAIVLRLTTVGLVEDGGRVLVWEDSCK